MKEKKMRVLLTEKCNKSCANCFYREDHGGQNKDMPLKQAEMLFKRLSELDYKVLKIMGGEPMIHPDFYYLLGLANSLFNRVTVFTNGTAENFKPEKFSRKNAVIINFKFYKSIMYERFAELSRIAKGLIFAIIIDNDTDTSDICGKINEIYHILSIINPDSDVIFQVSLDCMADPLKNREELNRKWLSVAKYIHEISPQILSFDHVPPECFWNEDSLRFLEDVIGTDYHRSGCGLHDSGLIDASLNLRFCNVYPEPLGSLWDGEKLINMELIPELLQEGFKKKQELLKALPLCSTCTSQTCNGGCFPFTFNKN
ncbi:MAG: radical SAM protein [Candidatus Eremiobacterota bacterium]